MDLASMLDREDFFGLFPASVTEYFRQAEGKTVHIQRVKRCGHANLVVKPHLSALMSPHISKNARAFFYSEWNPRGGLLKNFAVRVYVFSMLHTGRLFSQYRFRMEPAEDSLRELVIAPNNRSIRFFNYQTGIVGCMVKDGFSDKYFQNQLSFRLNHDYPFLLPLECWGERWFTEPILKGHPLARITDDKIYRKGFFDALADIRQLAADTSRTVNAESYLAELCERLLSLTAQAAEKKHISTAAQTEMLIRKVRELTHEVSGELPVCMSHGDLQTGNIWVDVNGNTLIYDWETAGERSVWYDATVLSYSLRRDNGWRDFLSDRAAKQAYFTDLTPEENRCEALLVRCTVLLEDILFRIEDMMELPQDWGRDIYDRYIDMLDKAVSEVGMV